MAHARVWPTAVVLRSDRLFLEPLCADHAVELAPLLNDQTLHAFIGGEPATVSELESRYERQSVGHSADGSEGWLNWVVRRRDDGAAAGTVQATLHEEAGRLVADVAWVVVPAQQRRGFAREAAISMTGWLRDHGVRELIAHVHPDHAASQGVARALGLAPTDARLDGEVVWRSP